MDAHVGGETGGYCASGRLNTASPPASVMTIDSTVAKIGRSMKNRENMVDAFGGARAITKTAGC